MGRAVLRPAAAEVGGSRGRRRARPAPPPASRPSAVSRRSSIVRVSSGSGGRPPTRAARPRPAARRTSAVRNTALVVSHAGRHSVKSGHYRVERALRAPSAASVSLRAPDAPASPPRPNAYRPALAGRAGGRRPRRAVTVGCRSDGPTPRRCPQPAPAPPLAR